MDGKLRIMFVATMAVDTLPVVSAGRQAVHALHRAFLGRLQARSSVRHISIQQYNPRLNIAVQPSVVSARGVIYGSSDRV
jgi:hypothetical protein